MLTNIWYKNLKAMSLYAADEDSGYDIVDVTGTKYKMTYDTASKSNVCFDSKVVRTSYPSSSGTSGVVFGNGDTLPTLEDYMLSGDIITGIATTSTRTCKQEGDIVITKFVFTITNNKADDVVIKEVGYVGISGGLLNGNWRGLLLDRTLLEEPVTIPTGGVGQVTYTIEFNNA